MFLPKRSPQPLTLPFQNVNVTGTLRSTHLMIRFAPQASSAANAPQKRSAEATTVSGVEQAGMESAIAALLPIPELDTPVAASSRKVKARGVRKPKAGSTGTPVQLDLAT